MADLSVPFVDEQAMKGMAEGNVEVGGELHAVSIVFRVHTQRVGCFLPADPGTVT